MLIYTLLNNRKKHSFMLCFVIGIFFLLITSNTQAIELSVSPYVSHFNYQEFDSDNDEILNEKGTLHGLELSLKGNTKRLHGAIEVSYLVGEVGYSGQTQSGRLYKTKTQQRIIQYGASLGYRYVIEEFSEKNMSIQPDLNISAYHWQRDILPSQRISRLTEDYNGFIAQPSLILTYSDHELQLGLTHTLNNTMTIQPTSCIERVTVKPKGDTSWFVRGEYLLKKSDFYTSSLWTSYKRYRMRESDIESGDTCFGSVEWYEPKNAMQLFLLGLKFTF